MTEEVGTEDANDAVPGLTSNRPRRYGPVDAPASSAEWRPPRFVAFVPSH